MIATLKNIYGILTRLERREAAVLLGLTAIGMLLEALGIGLIIPTLALLIQPDLAAYNAYLGPYVRPLLSRPPTQVATIAMVVLMATYGVKNAFLGYFVWRQNRMTNHVRANISRRLLTIYLRQPWVFYLEKNSAELMRNITGEANTFSGTLTHAINLVTEGMVLVGIAGLLVLVEPVGTLLTIVLLGLSALAFYALARKQTLRWGSARQVHDALLLQHLQQALGGVKDVKLLGRERDLLGQYDVHNVASARALEFQSTMTQLPRLWLEQMAVVGLATLIISMLAQGREMVAIVPRLALFAAAAFRIMPSVTRVVSAVQAIRFGAPAVVTLHAELQRPAPEPRLANGDRWKFGSEIRFDDVTFTYPSGATPALAAASLAIRRGESVGFVGSSGSGKSTLIDVMLGLLAPQSGHVLVDGHDIHADPRVWQRQIGYVPQSIYLTDDSLRRNVAFGLANDQIDDAAVMRALKAAQLEDFVASLPDGWNTNVGERGVRISGGQRQRLGIARALYHEPPVLVLDEATSALDTDTERSVMDSVNALHHSKTILIVAHRLSTVQQCDRVFRLEGGRVLEISVPLPDLSA